MFKSYRSRTSHFFTRTLFLLCGMATVAATPVMADGNGGEDEVARKYFLEDDAEYQLRQLPDEWEGVRYLYGGSSRSGIDCSAFVQQAYRDVFGIRIPRTTLGQLDAGYSIHPDELKAGDLILFYSNASRSSRHVGIAVGNGEFVHISSSRRNGGVKIVNLEQYLQYSGISLLDTRRVAHVLDSFDYNITINHPELNVNLRETSVNSAFELLDTMMSNRSERTTGTTPRPTSRSRARTISEFEYLDRQVSRRIRNNESTPETVNVFPAPREERIQSVEYEAQPVVNPDRTVQTSQVTDSVPTTQSWRIVRGQGSDSTSDRGNALYAGVYSF